MQKRRDIGRLCECGCGKLVNPGNKYIHGHNNRGKGEGFTEELREKIRDRDGRFCQLCGRSELEIFKFYKDDLNVHHIDYDRSHNDEENLVSLCRECHSKTGFDREFWQVYFMKMMEERN